MIYFTGRLDSWKIRSFTSEQWESSSLPSHLVNTWNLWGVGKMLIIASWITSSMVVDLNKDSKLSSEVEKTTP